MTSILNMGGHLVDLGTKYRYSEGITQSDQDIISDAENRLIIAAAKKRGLSAKEAATVPARVRRAQRAATLAFTLAAADGPLPIGDMLAIGVLAGYATYEVYTVARDFLD